MAESSNWVDISLESAKTHPLYGVGGWLSLIVLGQFLAPFFVGFGLYESYGKINYSTLSDIFAAFIAVELAANAILGIWSWANVWLIFNKRPATVRSIITLLALAPAFVIADALAVKFIPQYLAA